MQDKERNFTEVAEKIVGDVLRRQIDLKANNKQQSPNKQQERSGSRHFTGY